MKRRNFFRGLLGGLGLLVIPVARTAVAREEIGSNPTQPSKKEYKWKQYYATVKFESQNEADLKVANAMNKMLKESEKELERDLWGNL